MLNLPQSTEVNLPLPKSQIYKKFEFKQGQCDAFDADVSRLDFVNWIAPRTLPAIAEGAKVKDIFVVEVALKKRDFDPKNIALLAKSIPQHIVYLLRYDDEYRLAVYYTRLFLTDWQFLTPNSSFLTPHSSLLTPNSLDIVWENLARDIVGTSLRDVSNADASQAVHAEGMSLQEQIEASDRRAKIERQIATLERQMNATKQPRRKRELFLEIQKLKGNHG